MRTPDFGNVTTDWIRFDAEGSWYRLNDGTLLQAPIELVLAGDSIDLQEHCCEVDFSRGLSIQEYAMCVCVGNYLVASSDLRDHYDFLAEARKAPKYLSREVKCENCLENPATHTLSSETTLTYVCEPCGTKLVKI